MGEFRNVRVELLTHMVRATMRRSGGNRQAHAGYQEPDTAIVIEGTCLVLSARQLQLGLMSIGDLAFARGATPLQSTRPSCRQCLKEAKFAGETRLGERKLDVQC